MCTVKKSKWHVTPERRWEGLWGSIRWGRQKKPSSGEWWRSRPCRVGVGAWSRSWGHTWTHWSEVTSFVQSNGEGCRREERVESRAGAMASRLFLFMVKSLNCTLSSTGNHWRSVSKGMWFRFKRPLWLQCEEWILGVWGLGWVGAEAADWLESSWSKPGGRC